ncbi:adenylate kinase family protein [Fluviispira multicolorata]|uniref:Adenylate kinase n=1 Tax=Fluviispira multicolorata TaxID=2654512 RepID=A0A833JCD3_9BACT|nr:nucleoside monophosphate kinase [Fluviispira multicolorata]KAB8029755.1 adenylate kinase [Fluviispira multicolorata]
MKVIIFLGPPGVGKGTQCSLLNSRLGVKHISTGAIIRQEIASESALGLKVKGIVESGHLIDDKSMFLCLENALSSMTLNQNDIVLMDGIPRNLSQAKEFDTLLSKFLSKVDLVLSLTADLEKLVERFERRWTCSACGKVDSIAAHTEVSRYSCVSCGKLGSMFRRKDDEPETVRRRFTVYQQETFPLVSYYADRNLLSIVDGLKSPEIVYAEIVSILMRK